MSPSRANTSSAPTGASNGSSPIKPQTMSDRYILNKDGEPVLEPDLMAWSEAFETGDRIVKQEYVGDFWVSTVFLGLDHGFYDGGPPILWETMVFRKGTYDNVEMDRCSGTREQALAMHQAMVERVTAHIALEE